MPHPLRGVNATDTWPSSSSGHNPRLTTAEWPAPAGGMVYANRYSSAPSPGQHRVRDAMLSDYQPGNFYCELSRGGAVQPVCDRLAALSVEELRCRAANAEIELHDRGITFTVYSDKDA